MTHKPDLQSLPSVSIFIRAILFLGLGGFGLVMSRFFYSDSSKK